MQHAVEQTLEEIGAGERPRLLVLNKIDLLDEQARDELRLRYPDAMLVSGVTGEGLEELGARFEAELAHMLCPVELLVPYADGGSLAELHELAGDLTRKDTPEGVRVARWSRSERPSASHASRSRPEVVVSGRRRCRRGHRALA